MALGTNLKSDIETAISLSDDASEFSADMAAAINNYLSGAVYAFGAGTYSNTLADGLFILPTNGTAASAATIIANGVQSYWGLSVAAVPADVTVPANVEVIECTILAPAVATTLHPLLVGIFSDISIGVTASQKAALMANAIETSIATITTTHTELTPPPASAPTPPIIGSIE